MKNTIKMASVSSRVFAFIIDWIVSGLLVGAVNALFYTIYSSTKEVYTDYYSFLLADISISQIMVPFVLCMLIGLVYYVWIPYKVWPGQTLGKHLFDIQILSSTQDVSLGKLFIRNFVCMILIGCASPISTALRQFITVCIRINVDEPWLVLGSVVCLISFLMTVYKSTGSSIHDRIVKTQVVAA